MSQTVTASSVCANDDGSAIHTETHESLPLQTRPWYSCTIGADPPATLSRVTGRPETRVTSHGHLSRSMMDAKHWPRRPSRIGHRQDVFRNWRMHPSHGRSPTLSDTRKVAQHFAATGDTTGLRGVILVAPAPLRGIQLPAEAKQQQSAACTNANSVRGVLHHVLPAGPGSLTEHDEQQCIRDPLRGNDHVKAAWPEYGLEADYAELEAKISDPVTVLRGDKDFERDTVGQLGVDCGWINKTVEDCGHLVPLERPHRVVTEILVLLDSVRGHPG